MVGGLFYDRKREVMTDYEAIYDDPLAAAHTVALAAQNANYAGKPMNSDDGRDE